jgi:3-hydroxyacyl-[acyl-carrier-protein] dehydratase
MRFEYFQLIDRIVDLDLGNRTIRTQATVPTSSTIFEGHFPGFPLMPGVLLLESMAQTSGWLIIGITGFSRMPFLAAFSQAKLRAFVRPGDTLEITASLTHEGSGFARTKAEIRNDGKLACNGEITFRVVEFPNQEFRRHMEKAAAALAFPMESPANG